MLLIESLFWNSGEGLFFIFYFGLDFWVFLGVSYETIQVVFYLYVRKIGRNPHKEPHGA